MAEFGLEFWNGLKVSFKNIFYIKSLLKDSNIRNFTIYYSPTLHLLFSHLEYIGTDFAADQAKIAEHEETKEWWKVMEQFQVPLSWHGPPPSQGGDGGEWWESLEELFHNGHEPANYRTTSK